MTETTQPPEPVDSFKRGVEIAAQQQNARIVEKYGVQPTDAERAQKAAERAQVRAEQAEQAKGVIVAVARGRRKPEIVCQHCQTRGLVRAHRANPKRGVSGGKMVLAFFTLGFSMLFMGLARRQPVTKFYCENCGSKWAVDR